MMVAEGGGDSGSRIGCGVRSGGRLMVCGDVDSGCDKVIGGGGDYWWSLET